MIGTSLDRYKIVDELGHGGMSTVYRGVDEALERSVAVKVMHDHLAKSIENRKRFHREAKAIAKLKHPNILEIYDYSSFEATRSFIIMELVEGLNLRQFVADNGTMPAEIVALIALELCAALSHAHQSGVIHRDLKPENVMISKKGNIKLMDFGIAHVVGAETMTQTGSILGSPAHIPPELIDGQPVDIRSDIYSLGTILYFLATGALPYDGVNAPQVFKKVLTGIFEDPEFVEAKVGGRFGAIIKTCMEKVPKERYQTVDSLVEALDEYLNFVPLSDEDELSEYFRDPKVYTDSFPERIVPKLVTAAQQLREENNVPKLVSYFNRILAYDPENGDVQTMMKSLGRKKVTRNAMILVALLATLFAGVYAFKTWSEGTVPVIEEKTEFNQPKVVEVLPKKEDETPRLNADQLAKDLSALVNTESQKLANRQAELLAAQREKNNKTVVEKKTNQKTSNNQTTPKVGDTTPALVTFPYRFKITPGAATFSIDGKSYDLVSARRGIELSEGPHRIRVGSTGAETISKTLNVRGPQKKILLIVLNWKPGRVQVVSNKDAVVWVENQKLKRIGSGGKNATFPIPFGPADRIGSKKRITIRVASTQDMGHPKVQRVLVKPGQLTTINVNF